MTLFYLILIILSNSISYRMYLLILFTRPLCLDFIFRITFIILYLFLYIG